jgi:hypothetical protein
MVLSWACGWRWPCSSSSGDLVCGGIQRVGLSPANREAPRDFLVILFVC